MTDVEILEVPDFVAEAETLDEIIEEDGGVINPLMALAMEAWALVFTFTANTAFFFETKEYFETEELYTGDNALFNRVFFGLDWVQLGANAVAFYLLYSY